MSPNWINDILSNITNLDKDAREILQKQAKKVFEELEDAEDLDNMKVLFHRLKQLTETCPKNPSHHEKKDFNKLIHLIEEMEIRIEKIQKEINKDSPPVDVVKNFKKKYAPVDSLPASKKKTHILVALKKENLEYEEEMLRLQIELAKLQRYIQDSGRKVLIIFEGRDAAGKGGNIKRFMESLNPRYAKVVALAKPTEIERGQWYFQRYTAHLPNASEIVFFDRSWYNRAGVEPVMGFVNKNQYELFLDDVPVFEKLLVKSGIKIIKFYFSVSKEEQAKRFEERKTNPLKQFKLSAIDQSSQNLWEQYSIAEYQNFLHTHSTHAPWIIVNSDDKEAARLNAIKFLLSQFNYPGKDKSGLLRLNREIIVSVKDHLNDLEKEDIQKKKLF